MLIKRNPLTRSLAFFVDSDTFHGLLLTVLWSQSNYNGWRTSKCAYVLVINTRGFGRFWPVSWTITHCFGVPEWFPRLTNPGVIYMSVISTHSFGWFWPVPGTITHRFVVPKQFLWLSNPKVCLHLDRQDSQFWQILARFLDHYSLLGSRSDFHDWWTPTCVYVSVINIHSFGRF